MSFLLPEVRIRIWVCQDISTPLIPSRNPLWSTWMADFVSLSVAIAVEAILVEYVQGSASRRLFGTHLDHS